MPKLYLAIFTNEYGFDYKLFDNPNKPEKWRQEIANKYWDEEIPDREKPKSLKVLADEYFHYMGEDAFEEWFEVSEIEVE